MMKKRSAEWTTSLYVSNEASVNEVIMREYSYKVIIEPQSEGGFTAYVPGLPGCVTEAETYAEALNNIQEALALYIECKRERGAEIVPDATCIAEVRVSV